ncbi:sugar transferase [Campylobacter jejuni]|nr:sugar transferase [Campylobacter jejuni]ELF8344414.1 sugar transferase [Campylobacter jejuni]ELX4826328.1 sugar transferase [Campylobacter jejuni]MBX2194136.1 sugar transferase [Campylobacter jejuni]HEC2893897.1 sugar transferase [Campylobacter jejuni]
MSFNKNTFNLNLLGIHLWNDSGICEIQIKNPKDQIFNRSLDYNFSYFFDTYNRQFKITNDTKILNNGVNNINLISFFLASPEGNYHTEEIDLEALANENIEIPKEYNFNHLIPPIELYKEIIDEYCSIMDPVKLAPLQKQIKEKDNIISTLNQEKTTLQNELNSFPIKKQRLELANLEQDLIIKKLESKKLAKSLGIKMSIINPKITFIQANSAKARIQNHLSYKLGQALIANSKSILGYIRMPYVLSYIKNKHKFEQKAYGEKIKENPNLALPPLETYPDYNEALKEKECFTYKLGEALMQANKNWYGGGYIKFIFKDVPRLKREFGKKG